MDEIIARRARLLDALTEGLPVEQSYPLIREVRLDSAKYRAAQDAVSDYIRASLRAAGTNVNGWAPEVMVRLLERELFAMPNVTPNGIIKPKLDNAIEFALVHKRVADLVADLQLPGRVAKMRLPLVLRMVAGVATTEVTGRPRANNVMHSDFWTGSCCDLALILPFLGDVESTTIAFGEPVGAADDFLQELPSYRDGAALYHSIRPYNMRMRKGYIYYQDIYCLHGTLRQGGGIRVSMDWTVQTANYPEVEQRHSSRALATDNHFDLETWNKVGRELMFLDSETVAQTAARFAAGRGAEKVALGSAVAGQTSSTSKVVSLVDAPSVLQLAKETP